MCVCVCVCACVHVHYLSPWLGVRMNLLESLPTSEASGKESGAFFQVCVLYRIWLGAAKVRRVCLNMTAYHIKSFASILQRILLKGNIQVMLRTVKAHNLNKSSYKDGDL